MKSAIFLLAVFAIISCNKAKDLNEERDLLNEAKAFIGSSGLDNMVDKESNLPRKFLQKLPNWEKAQVIRKGEKKWIITPIIFEKDFLVKSSFSSELYSINDISYLIITPTENSKFEMSLATIFPSKSGEKLFEGVIQIEKSNGDLDFSLKVENNKTYISQKNDSKIKTDGIIKVERSVSGYNYSPETGEGYYWTENMGSSYIYFSDGFGYGSGGGYTPGPSNDLNLGPIYDIAPSILPTNFIVRTGDNIIADILAYNKCFQNSKDGKFEVTIFVQQPLPGTRATWRPLEAYSAVKEKSPITVGHTFLGLKQTVGGKTVYRNVGYYPSSMVTPASPITSGDKNNDEEEEYNISLSVQLTSDQFYKILNYVNSDIRYYNLNSFNCTTFALDALSKAGINLPRTEGTWINGGGLNPGDLGEDIRAMKISSGMSKSALNANHKNEGSCN